MLTRLVTFSDIRVDLDELPYENGTFDLIHIRFAHPRVCSLLSKPHAKLMADYGQVHSFPRLLGHSFKLLRRGGLMLLFDYDLLPILADETTPLAAQAWHDAFSRSMRVAKMNLFSLEKVLPSLAGKKIDGKDMRVPIGHGDGTSPCPPSSTVECKIRHLSGIGRMGQLGKIHYINTKAFLESARHVMVVHGGYTDAEVDVLCEFYLICYPYLPPNK